MCSNEGSKKYQRLSALARCALTLSHGNADPERGFSVNKHLLNIHGSAVGEQTIHALRLVKDFIVRSEGFSNVVVTKSLIRDCQNSHALYTAQRLEEDRQRELVANDTRQRENEQQKAAELEEIDNDLMVIERGIEIAEAAIKEGNDELEGLLRQSSLDRNALASAHGKTSMGVKRKTELESALAVVKEKRRKFESSDLLRTH